MAAPSEPYDLSARVIAVIAKTQRIDELSVSSSSTFEQLGIDSLDGINIIFALENDFQIEISDEAVQNIRSVRDAVEGVRQLVEAKQPARTPGAA